jgi:hypothetical protein
LRSTSRNSAHRQVTFILVVWHRVLGETIIKELASPNEPNAPVHLRDAPGTRQR